MKTKKIVVLLLILIIITTTVFFITLATLKQVKKPIKIIKIKTNVTINKTKIGFDLGHKDAITFGTLKPGGLAKRSIILNNTFNFPIKVKVACSGDICPFLLFKDSFIIPKRSTKNVYFTLNPSKNIEEKTYSGEIIIKIYQILRR